MIDLDAMDYLLAVWFVRGRGVDWMAACFKEKGHQDWSMLYRFRYYSGTGDPFDDTDRKNWYRGSMAGSEPKKKLLETIDGVAGAVAERFGAHEVDRVDIDGDPHLFIERAADRPWFHLQQRPIV